MIRLPAHAVPLVRELAAWARGRRERMRIEGRSMVPTLANGDMVLVDPRRRPQLDDLVAARPVPLDGMAVVKRVSRLAPDGSVDLASDNPAEGTDSRSWGPVAADRIDGVVTFELSRRRVLTAEVSAEARPSRWLRR